MVVTACWTTIKEVAFTAGLLVRHLPLPQHRQDPAGSASPSAAGCELISVEQVSALGSLLVRLLLDMKHNGAVDKAHTGLRVLAEPLLKDAHPGLNSLPAAWLAACQARMVRPGQGLGDIVRRSGGITFAHVSAWECVGACE